ncbi:hypothetical protein LSH36_20g07002 [Paralvinella palmiformis]|uniref:Uncharacterized protein n=1 Tax=Paralvinella palmiformis TaxID=53620 RepID=A0AAD9KCF3_9ANNE|nr:hypothetical protein LSH36_20g07002 [Paralvinella palmiformis]
MHNNICGQKSMAEEAFNESNLSYEIPSRRHNSGPPKTKIVVSLPSAQSAIRNPSPGRRLTGYVGHFLNLPKEVDDCEETFGLPIPKRGTVLAESGHPDYGMAKRPQRTADADLSGRIAIKVRKKDNRKHRKVPSLFKKKRHRRSRLFGSRQETEYPLGDYDSVESLIHMDSVQMDSPRSAETDGGGGVRKAEDRDSFLPRLSTGQRLPNLTEYHSPSPTRGLTVEDCGGNVQQAATDGEAMPVTSLPAIAKVRQRRPRPVMREKTRRNPQRNKCDKSERTQAGSPADVKVEALHKPELKKEEVDLGIRKILVDENSPSLSTVIRFRDPPKPQPLTLAFEYPKNYLTHRYVLDMVKNQIHSVPYGYVTALQFQDCNVRKSTVGLLNRWLVTVSCPEARDQLLRMGIKLFNRKTNLRRYDDILNEEFKQFNAWIRSVKKVLGSDEYDLLSPE